MFRLCQAQRGALPYGGRSTGASCSRHPERPSVYMRQEGRGMQQFQEGAVFAGRYRIVRCLGAGGMGAVYEVVHLETDRRRALKVMLPHVFESAELRERF